MPLFYCDHNFVSRALSEPEEYKTHLRKLVEGGEASFVLSPMHWVDAAEDTDQARGDAKADFMDSLNPIWLFDRRSIQRREVSAKFFRSIGIEQDQQLMGSIGDVIFDLIGTQADRNSRAFINHFRNIGANHPLERSLEQALEANRHNTARFQAGTISPGVAERIERLYIFQLIPLETPSRVAIDETTRRDYARDARLDDHPSIALEHASTRDNWTHGREMSRNNFVDQQHLIAVPYVDFFITDDRKLRSLIRRVTNNVAYPIGELLTKEQFDARYPLATRS